MPAASISTPQQAGPAGGGEGGGAGSEYGIINLGGGTSHALPTSSPSLTSLTSPPPPLPPPSPLTANWMKDESLPPIVQSLGLRQQGVQLISWPLQPTNQLTSATNQSADLCSQPISWLLLSFHSHTQNIKIINIKITNSQYCKRFY